MNMARYNLDDYVQVNERIEKFYEKYPNGSIQTEIASLENGVVIFKAYAYRDEADVRPATGHAYEKEGSSFINETSYIENCETSAVGRALAMLGFEIKKSIASKEEVENAKLQQTADKNIDDLKVQSLQLAIKKYNMKETDVKAILDEFNYEEVKDIKIKDFKAICNKLEALKEA
jgi:hypothetical protein